jgi:hypothetical protein
VEQRIGSPGSRQRRSVQDASQQLHQHAQHMVERHGDRFEPAAPSSEASQARHTDMTKRGTSEIRNFLARRSRIVALCRY